ncbi:MAG: hypothetical protein O2905_07560, partial [Proteobacteria bacterium]|nr:hypothetical protein [Pseudomonadota bacterium]
MAAGTDPDLDPPPEYLRRGPPSPYGDGDGTGFWRRALPVFIAVVTLGAFAGGVWFAYAHGVRQGLRLTPPLVQAESGPVKVVPKDPGGIEVPNQDREVFDMLEGGNPEPRIEQLLPQPETPLDLPPPEPEPQPGRQVEAEPLPTPAAAEPQPAAPEALAAPGSVPVRVA